ncbi:hypothetical protein EAI89_12085 [Eubacterium sp. am_0171]|nr:hypothetical protein EAI89_12085 [Eubacterium sp. am_0171]
MHEEYKNTDIYVRREVGRFLSERMQSILLDGYQVPGITAQFAIRNRLIYRKESGGYDNAGV